MDQPVTETSGVERVDAQEWLIDADDPLLTDGRLTSVADPSRPDRLAWNTFRTLGLWNTEAWAPRLLEIACGEESRLAVAEWDGGDVVPWAADLPGHGICDVALIGPVSYVVLACTLDADVPLEDLRAAAMAALDGSLDQARDAGLVVVAPPGSYDLRERLEQATDIELHEGKTAFELLDGAMGWISWPELGTLAADMVEEGSSDTELNEPVHRLITELQDRFPAEEI